MMKRMTADEFHDLMEEIGLDVDKHGFGLVACMLSNYFYACAEKYEEQGYTHSAEWERKRAMYISDVLDKIGYFEDINQ